MERVWFRRDQAAVTAALRSGRSPDMATTMACGPLDELVGLHRELGVFDALDELSVKRRRSGVEDGLLLRTLAVLPFLEAASLDASTGQLFGEPAILLELGWSPLQITWGDNERHRQGNHRLADSLPCHPDTLRDELRRVTAASWEKLQATEVSALYERGLVQGRVYAIDGTGLGDGVRLVCLVCVSAKRPKIVAWRLLQGDASEKGKEAAVTRSLVEQALALGGPNVIDLLLVDALYADGPLLAWLKYERGIDVLVPIPADRKLHEDLLGLERGGLLHFRNHSYVHTVQGHKSRRALQIACRDGLTSWDSFVAAAQAYGAQEPCLWACLIREAQPDADGNLACWTLASTRAWPNGVAAFEAYRPRWHVENDAYRELKEGWRLESQKWGRDFATQLGRVALTCLAFNTAQVYLGEAGKQLAARGIRRLRREHDRKLGHSPVVIYIHKNYAVYQVEELLALLGHGPSKTLRPLATGRAPPKTT